MARDGADMGPSPRGPTMARGEAWMRPIAGRYFAGQAGAEITHGRCYGAAAIGAFRRFL
jgi:hypothetical protein